MKLFVDANVWIPILVENHAHHKRAWQWWTTIADREAVWCRMTQMSVLRLLTNSIVMHGTPLSLAESWSVWQRVEQDPRTSFYDVEPAGIAGGWSARIQGRATTPNLWMDAYLAALAELSGFGFATFDKGFRQMGLTNLVLLAA